MAAKWYERLRRPGRGLKVLFVAAALTLMGGAAAYASGALPTPWEDEPAGETVEAPQPTVTVVDPEETPDAAEDAQEAEDTEVADDQADDQGEDADDQGEDDQGQVSTHDQNDDGNDDSQED